MKTTIMDRKLAARQVEIDRGCKDNAAGRFPTQLRQTMLGLLVLFGCFSLGGVTEATAGIKTHQIFTSVSYGTFTPPRGYGPAIDKVFTQTDLSAELADRDIPGSRFFPATPPFPKLLATLGTLSNLAFLTSNPTDRGNAGLNLFYKMDSLVGGFQAAHPGLTVQVTKSATSLATARTGSRDYSLYGGVSGTTTEVGIAHVDFYHVNYTLSAVPAATSLTLTKKTIGGNGTFSFSSPTSALAVSLTTTNGMASSGAIPLRPGVYTVTEKPANDFALSKLACQSPDHSSTTNLASRTATIRLSAGEAITCTFTGINTLRH